MTSRDIHLSAVALQKKLTEGELTATALLDQYFDHIDGYESQIDALLSILKESAYQAASMVDGLYLKGDPVPTFAGIPIIVKDDMCLMGEKTTCASRILENFVAPYDATVIKKLKEC